PTLAVDDALARMLVDGPVVVVAAVVVTIVVTPDVAPTRARVVRRLLVALVVARVGTLLIARVVARIALPARAAVALVHLVADRVAGERSDRTADEHAGGLVAVVMSDRAAERRADARAQKTPGAGSRPAARETEGTEHQRRSDQHLRVKHGGKPPRSSSSTGSAEADEGNRHELASPRGDKRARPCVQ